MVQQMLEDRCLDPGQWQVHAAIAQPIDHDWREWSVRGGAAALVGAGVRTVAPGRQGKDQAVEEHADSSGGLSVTYAV
jgi:hypothetical protein